MDQLIALNRAAYQAVLDDVSDNLQTVVDAIASCEADIADREARLRVLHLQRDQLAETRERYEAFLAHHPAPASNEKGVTDDDGPPF